MRILKIKPNISSFLDGNITPFARVIGLQLEIRIRVENYKDVLAKFANQMNMKIATETATSEQNELKKQFGRIVQTNHCSLRLAERNLEIPRDIVRKRLVELKRADAVLFHKETSTFIPIKPTKGKNWLAITAYEVDGIEEAQRKTEKTGTQLLVF